MHALTILHRILSENFPAIHAKRLASLMAAVEATVSGSRLTLSDLGRGLSGPVAVKHNIKRIDRLLGGCVPILISDAGFRSPWFMAGQSHGLVLDRAHSQPRHGQSGQ